ncbi:hypothetical protein NPIL_103141 [Nephila pilipes]|uniref:Uncharacterized protein n=1 Tax=Nephila pilipes TaxID=299642 RepID=A0A8X6TMU5_NEPPI|nr:hypothetical protein NPIL_103141 [Nephila pilipes]
MLQRAIYQGTFFFFVGKWSITQTIAEENEGRKKKPYRNAVTRAVVVASSPPWKKERYLDTATATGEP